MGAERDPADEVESESGTQAGQPRGRRGVQTGRGRRHDEQPRRRRVTVDDRRQAGMALAGVPAFGAPEPEDALPPGAGVGCAELGGDAGQAGVEHRLPVREQPVECRRADAEAGGDIGECEVSDAEIECGVDDVGGGEGGAATPGVPGLPGPPVRVRRTGVEAVHTGQG
jgi:hypothetical protein